ncbi:unnamed protein product [Sphagnum balticum]
MEPPERTDANTEDEKQKDAAIAEGTNFEDISVDIRDIEDPKVDDRKLEDVKMEEDMKIDDAKMDDELDDSPIEETTIGEEGADEIIRARSKERNGVKRTRNTKWNESETLTLIAATHAESQKHPNSLKRGGLNYQRKWVAMAERCRALGVQRSPHQLKKRWNSLHSNYVHIKQWQSRPGTADFWAMDRKERMNHKLPAYFDDVFYKALEHPSSVVLPIPVTSASKLGSKSVKPVVADSVEQGTSAGDDALDSSEDNGRSTFPVITFPPPFSQPPPLPPLPSLPSLQLPLPLSLPQLQMPPHFPALSRPPRAPGPAPLSVGNGLAPIQPEDLKSVWLETFLLGFSVDPKVIKALETEEVTVKVLVDEGTEEGVYKLLRMVAEATGVKITVGQQARVWHAVRQWQDNKRKAQELEGPENLCIFARGAVAKEQQRGHFLKVAADPLGNFVGPFLIWVRECYEDLRRIINNHLRGSKYNRFIVLGTEGTGKSLFGVFWVLQMAAQRVKVVWKINQQHFLLDFADSVNPRVIGPCKVEDLANVFDDPSAWYVIDAQQETSLHYRCKMLLVCSTKPSNYKEFQKNARSLMLYMPVWTEVEIKTFLEEFEVWRPEYGNMHVNLREQALGNFSKLGGIPRYVLDNRKRTEGVASLNAAMNSLTKSSLLPLLTGEYMETTSDKIVHIRVDDTHEYETASFCYAARSIQQEIGQKFVQLDKVEACTWLTNNIDNTPIAHLWGHLFEHVAHSILQEGGSFKRKRVTSDGNPMECSNLELQQTLSQHTFHAPDDLKALGNGTYCTRSPLTNFESIDAVITPNRFFQMFKWTSNNSSQGYKVLALQQLDTVLGRAMYELHAVVPMQRYDETSFQRWINNGGGGGHVNNLLQKFEQYVVGVELHDTRLLGI